MAENKAIYNVVPGDNGFVFVAGGLRWDIDAGVVVCAECGRVLGELARQRDVYAVVVGGWPHLAARVICPACDGIKVYNANDIRAARLRIGMVEEVKTPA